MKIALVHLCSFGDCLYATLIARQIKRDYPGSHLTWVIGDKYASVLEGNPHVDKIYEIPVKGVKDALSIGWAEARKWVQSQLNESIFQKVYYTQILPDNAACYDGLIRSTTYRSYGKPIDGPHNPVLVLTAAEKNRVENFIRINGIHRAERAFLFECGARSGQSPMTPPRAEKLADTLARLHPSAVFILSSDTAVSRPSRQLIDGSSLSFRENAALSHYCAGLIGCSSGITWVTTSTAGRALPMLQILTKSTEMFKFASVALDFRRFNLDPSRVIEMTDPSDPSIIACVNTWLTESHLAARQQFGEELTPTRAHAENAYLALRGDSGRIAALMSAWRIVRVNGLRTVPWRVPYWEFRSCCRALGRLFFRPRWRPKAGA